MDVASADSNSFEVRGLYMLTSPNMAGKSTLMRSTAAAALLTACGLCVPLGKGS
jgi:DNA mismatch repair ATPase MutS